MSQTKSMRRILYLCNALKTEILANGDDYLLSAVNSLTDSVVAKLRQAVWNGWKFRNLRQKATVTVEVEDAYNSSMAPAHERVKKVAFSGLKEIQ